MDKRIENVMARLDDWQGHGDARDVGRSMEAFLEWVHWDKQPIEVLRGVMDLITKHASDELLDELNQVADNEHRVYLECTVGNEITAALVKAGVTNEAIAEGIAQKALHAALAEALALARTA